MAKNDKNPDRSDDKKKERDTKNPSGGHFERGSKTGDGGKKEDTTNVGGLRGTPDRLEKRKGS